MWPGYNGRARAGKRSPDGRSEIRGFPLLGDFQPRVSLRSCTYGLLAPHTAYADTCGHPEPRALTRATMFTRFFSTTIAAGVIFAFIGVPVHAQGIEAKVQLCAV